MHRLLRINILPIFVLLGISAQGQNFEYPWAISGGTNLVNYRPHPGNPEFHENLFDVGYQIGFQKYLNKGFDFRTQLMIAPAVRFPAGIITRSTSPLVDLQYRLSFKLNNGIILKENGLIGPYLSVGLGGSYVSNHPDAYIPLGGGVRIRLSPRMALRLESTRKISVNKDYQSLNHALAFIYNLNTKKTKVELDPQEIEDIKIVASLIPPDTDMDGLIDSQDECPEVAGPLGMNGCPTKDFSKMDPDIVVIDESTLKEDPELTSTALDTSKPEVLVTLPTKTKAVPSADSTAIVIDLSKEEPSKKNEELVIGIMDEEKNSPVKEADPLKEETQKIVLPCGQVISDENIGQIHFAIGSDRISDKAYQQLDQIAEMMNSCTETKLVLSGHTDDKGTEKDNLILSIKRAFNVKYYLVHQHNISQFRITSDGLGEEKPLAENSTSTGREKNRRVDMRLVF